MKSFWKTKNFQIRWNEALGDAKCPYAYRYVIILFGYSIRLHKWLRSDDKRYMHNHAWWFITFVLKGSYIDVSYDKNWLKGETLHNNIKYKTYTKELIKDHLSQFSIRYRPSFHTHYVEIPKEGCWTLLITGKPLNKWGFWIKNRYLRPLRFFQKNGHPACDEQ